MSTPTALIVRRLRIARCAQAAATTVLVWDILLTSNGAVNYFWLRSGWSWTKGLFIANRYWSIFVTILNTTALCSPQVTDKFCYLWLKFLLPGAATIEVFIIQTIMVIRLRAIYMGNKWILRTLVPFFVVTSAICISATSLASRSMKTTAHPAPGFTMCVSLTSVGYNWVTWTMLFSFELVIVVLTAWKTWIHVRRSPSNGGSRTIRLLEIMLRDSTAYFLLILVGYAACTLLSSFAPPALGNILDCPILSYISILGTRMILNAKDEGARPLVPLDINNDCLDTTI